ncbi:hypothetical protein GCM10010331_75090 [Streptomyces xanthochromogenes]|nr:hypothetical protein GCM10010331_75090 [Streptomyces xanthochromogenes]
MRHAVIAPFALAVALLLSGCVTVTPDHAPARQAPRAHNVEPASVAWPTPVEAPARASLAPAGEPPSLPPSPPAPAPPPQQSAQSGHRDLVPRPRARRQTSDVPYSRNSRARHHARPPQGSGHRPYPGPDQVCGWSIGVTDPSVTALCRAHLR